MTYAELIRLAEEWCKEKTGGQQLNDSYTSCRNAAYRELLTYLKSLPVGGEEKPDEEIVFWMSEDELYYTIGLQNEARTVTIPIHTFPLHSNDIPIKIKVTSKEALSAEFTAKHPDWDKFL